MFSFNIFTIGVYGSVEESFFNTLIDNKIDTFCDIRQRRGVRGSQYSYVNSNYLQTKLNELGIRYHYVKELGLSPCTRQGGSRAAWPGPHGRLRADDAPSGCGPLGSRALAVPEPTSLSEAGSGPPHGAERGEHEGVGAPHLQVQHSSPRAREHG